MQIREYVRMYCIPSTISRYIILYFPNYKQVYCIFPTISRYILYFPNYKQVYKSSEYRWLTNQLIIILFYWLWSQGVTKLLIEYILSHHQPGSRGSEVPDKVLVKKW